MALIGTDKKFVKSKFDDIGIYVWVLPDGKYLMDEDGNTLSIASMYGDVIRMSRIAVAARSFGYNEGKPSFLPGYRKVSDEEYEHQKYRMSEGLIPDQYDISALEEQGRLQYGK